MDINCDLGEEMSNDSMLMGYVDSSNIACGGHAGDKELMIRTLRIAELYTSQPAHSESIAEEFRGCGINRLGSLYIRSLWLDD